MPGFYHNPKTVNDLVDFIVGKMFEQLGIEHNLYQRWGGSLLLFVWRLLQELIHVSGPILCYSLCLIREEQAL